MCIFSPLIFTLHKLHWKKNKMNSIENLTVALHQTNINDQPTLEDPIIKLLNEQLTFEEKDIFIQNFYAYLQYDEVLDFVVELNEELALRIGYNTKGNAKVLLVKYIFWKKETHRAFLNVHKCSMKYIYIFSLLFTRGYHMNFARYHTIKYIYILKFIFH